MINWDHRNCFSGSELDEVQIASKYLPPKILIESYVLEEEYYDYNFVAVPYMYYTGNFSKKRNETDLKDVFAPIYKEDSNSNVLFIKQISELKSVSYKDKIEIDFMNVPLKYNYIDLFMFPVKQHLFRDKITISFIDSDLNSNFCFSYRFVPMFSNNIGFFIGTFGRLSNNFWKFYPQLTGTFLMPTELIVNYTS